VPPYDQRRKVWLTPMLEYRAVLNAAKMRNPLKLEYGPMSNLMVALPNIGGALCSTPQSLADAHY